MTKRILSCVFAIILGLCVLCGCGKGGETIDSWKKGIEDGASWNHFRSNGNGQICSLRYAYDSGYLKTGDLQKIADLHNRGSSSSENLQEETSLAIKETIADKANQDGHDHDREAVAGDFEILRYYGNYRNSYAVLLRDLFHLYPTDVPETRFEVGGVEFYYRGYDYIGVFVGTNLPDWSDLDQEPDTAPAETEKWEAIVAEGRICSLLQAYENGYLTKDNLQCIAKLYNNNEQCAEPLDAVTENAIKVTMESVSRDDRYCGISDTKAEDFEILMYYGVYQESYVMILNNPYWDYPTVIVNEWREIAGVKFHIRGHETIIVWRKN